MVHWSPPGQPPEIEDIVGLLNTAGPHGTGLGPLGKLCNSELLAPAGWAPRLGTSGFIKVDRSSSEGFPPERRSHDKQLFFPAREAESEESLV